MDSTSKKLFNFFRTVSYSMFISSGKHLICDLKNIQNTEAMNSLETIREILDSICIKYQFCVLGKMEHCFEPQGHSIIYLLSESHISVHTFPEKNYIAMDIYTCRNYPNNSVYEEIYEFLVETFQAYREIPMIVDRNDIEF